MSVISYAIDTFPAGRGQEAKQPLSTHQARLCGRQGYGVALASIVEEGLDELKRRGVDHGLRAFQGQPATVTLFGGVAQAGGGGAVVLAEEAAAWTQVGAAAAAAAAACCTAAAARLRRNSCCCQTS